MQLSNNCWYRIFQRVIYHLLLHYKIISYSYLLTNKSSKAFRDPVYNLLLIKNSQRALTRIKISSWISFQMNHLYKIFYFINTRVIYVDVSMRRSEFDKIPIFKEFFNHQSQFH